LNVGFRFSKFCAGRITRREGALEPPDPLDEVTADPPERSQPGSQAQGL
jgi:hypothetical protein